MIWIWLNLTAAYVFPLKTPYRGKICDRKKFEFGDFCAVFSEMWFASPQCNLLKAKITNSDLEDGLFMPFLRNYLTYKFIKIIVFTFFCISSLPKIVQMYKNISKFLQKII